MLSIPGKTVKQHSSVQLMERATISLQKYDSRKNYQLLKAIYPSLKASSSAFGRMHTLLQLEMILFHADNIKRTTPGRSVTSHPAHLRFLLHPKESTVIDKQRTCDCDANHCTSSLAKIDCLLSKTQNPNGLTSESLQTRLHLLTIMTIFRRAHYQYLLTQSDKLQCLVTRVGYYLVVHTTHTGFRGAVVNALVPMSQVRS